MFYIFTMHSEEEREFAENIVSKIKGIHPEYRVEITGPRELNIGGKRLNLENLYRISRTQGKNTSDREAIIINYLEKMFEVHYEVYESFELVKDKIMPRIQPNKIFNNLDKNQVAHIPWVNDTSILFVRDLPKMTLSLTTENLIKWQVSIEDIEALAMKNLREYGDFEIKFLEPKKGGRVALIDKQDGYDAARLLMEETREEMIRELGGDYLAGIPARDAFCAVTLKPTALEERLKKRLGFYHKSQPYPISPDWFYVTHDGVAGTIGKSQDD